MQYVIFKIEPINKSINIIHKHLYQYNKLVYNTTYHLSEFLGNFLEISVNYVLCYKFTHYI